MRELKFRAYNHEVGMCSVSMISTEFHMIEIRDKNRKLDSFHYDDIELMQFTGLQDSKGNDIYENDIIKVPLWTEISDGFFKSCLFQVGFTDGCYVGRDLAGKDINVYLNEIDSGWIVGNTYENPELFDK